MLIKNPNQTEPNPVAWVLKSSLKFSHFCGVASVHLCTGRR